MTDSELPRSDEMRASLASRETIAPSSSEAVQIGVFPVLPAPFGKYRVTKLLGRGAMGTVYLAFDPDRNADVALKIPRFTADEDPVLLERFHREAQAVRDLDHPNICAVYDVGQIDSRHFIAMQYVDGRPLSDYISSTQSQRGIAVIIRKLALALAHAHDREIIHRDLKPANVMIDARGEVVMMDFGLARRLDAQTDVRATQSGMLVGSPAYMAPEQARADHELVNKKTDIYGLGVLFFEMLTGQLPFQGPIALVLGQIVSKAPPRLSSLRADVDPVLEKLCLQMLEKDLAKRPDSMHRVARELTEWLSARAPKEDATVPTQSPAAPLPPVKSIAQRVDRPIAIEPHQQRVRELVAQCEFDTAIELLEKYSKSKDPRHEKLIAWAKTELIAVRKKEQKLREASAPLCDTARQLLEVHDYEGAVKLLDDVPRQTRSIELRDLLREARDLLEECEHLERDIQDAIRDNEHEILPALVKQLLKLRPGNSQLKKLAADLKRDGAQKVIKQRKKQPHFLHTNESTYETKHLVLAVTGILALFGVVYVSTVMYASSKSENATLGGSTEPLASAFKNPLGAVTDKQRPPLARSPFSAREARSLQEEWARYLGKPVEFTNSIGMKFQLIPPGEYIRGTPLNVVEAFQKTASRTERSAWGRLQPSEAPPHKVTISKPFYLGTHEVRQRDYQVVIGTNPSGFSATGNRKATVKEATDEYPVERMFWSDAAQFCVKLSLNEGLKAPYRIQGDDVILQAGNGYRLPTEAEWEYACRAGTTTDYFTGDDPAVLKTIGWYRDNGDFRSHAVNKLKANPFGLYDMHGGLYEFVYDGWQSDSYQQYANSPAVDPMVAPTKDNDRILRGGSFLNLARSCRAAHRRPAKRTERYEDIGFRVVLNIDAAPSGSPGSGSPTSGPELATGAWQKLFDGQNLDQWAAPTNPWLVRDGAIIIRAESVRKTMMLNSKQRYRDFELKLQYRLLNNGLAGVRVRSVAPGSAKNGALVQLGHFTGDKPVAENVTGALITMVDGNPKILASPSDNIKAHFANTGRSLDWNDLSIKCLDSRYTVNINGYQTSDYIDASEQLSREGVISLCAAGFDKPTVEFRAIEIRPIGGASATPQPAPPKQVLDHIDVDFRKSVGGFWQTDQDWMKVAYEAGELRYIGRKQGAWFHWLSPAFTGTSDVPVRNFELETEFRVITPSRGEFAVVFGSHEERRIEVLMDREGRVRLNHTKQGQLAQPVKSGKPEPADDYRKLRVVVQHNRVRIFLDDEAVIERRLDNYEPGNVMLWVMPSDPPFEVRLRTVKFKRLPEN